MRTLVAIRSLLFSVILLAISTSSFAQIGISVSFGPPALPIYEQPIIPGDGYIWTPGYWAYADDDYYWVPATWVLAPQVGFLWTPGYWGWGGDAFFFHEGYWGPEVGFYGGIDYGYGYNGRGYEGGRWENNQFYYNTTVNNVNTTIIHNTYNTTVVNNNTVNRVSYNGGDGGTNARPSAREDSYAKQSHTPPVPAQHQHVQEARSNPELRASANQGKPPIAATAKPADFKSNAVPARQAGAPYRAPERSRATGNADRPGNSSQARPNASTHAAELPPHKYAAPSGNNGNSANNQRYQQQQDRLAAKQNQEHQKMQQQQEREHQKVARPNTSDTQKQQMEQRHFQQTQQLEQRHAAQQEKIQTRQQPRQGEQRNRPPDEKH
ncbi:MAG: YXWGXW repeat-containing protein [Candidatus Acidiferrum sp.]